MVVRWLNQRRWQIRRTLFGLATIGGTLTDTVYRGDPKPREAEGSCPRLRQPFETFCATIKRRDGCPCHQSASHNRGPNIQSAFERQTIPSDKTIRTPGLKCTSLWLSNTEIAFNINFRFILVYFDLATLQWITGRLFKARLNR